MCFYTAENGNSFVSDATENIRYLVISTRNPGSSVSTVSGYREDDPAIEVRFPTKAERNDAAGE
jgi:hypothetical protein